MNSHFLRPLEYEEQVWTVADYWTIVKRRHVHILVPGMVVMVLSLMLALGLPSVYRSSATILIEEQEIPREMVRSTITSFAAQQIQIITQRVMTVDNIEKIVEKFGLYGQSRTESKLPRTELAKRFRERVNLELVSADVIDPSSGRPTKATIAFTLAYEDRDPSTVQKVANELVTLYLNTNLSARTDKAAGASEFLAEQTRALNSELLILEARLAEFKDLNKGALPELYQFNLGVVERTERELAETNLRLQELEENRIRLSGELGQLSPSAPSFLPSGQAVLGDTDRLKALQSEYRKKSALYQDSHPDVRRLKRELEALQVSLSAGEDVASLHEQVQLQRTHLQQLRERYTVDHPQVVTATSVLRDLESHLASASRQPTTFEPVADNPAYVFIDTQIKSAAAESRSLRVKKLQLKRKLEEYEGLLQRAPTVEQAYQGMLREYNTANEKYQELRSKQRGAEVSRNLEQDRKGERFILIEPPTLPLEPESPNRLAIATLGLVFSVVVGIGAALLFEAADKGIYGARALQNVTGAPPLVVIPYLVNKEDEERSKRKLKALTIGVVTLGIATLTYVHFLYQPLDVLWFVILNRMGLG